MPPFVTLGQRFALHITTAFWLHAWQVDGPVGLLTMISPSFNLGRILTLALMTLAAIPLAQAAFKKSQIADSVIRNPSVGFYGLTVTIPQKWSVYAADPDPKRPTGVVAQHARNMATNVDDSPGNTTHEIITLHDGANGIALAIMTGVGNDWPSEKLDRKGYQLALDAKARGLRFRAGQVFVRETAVIGERRFAKIGRIIEVGGKQCVNLVYIVILAPSYEISLNGLAFQENQPVLENAMNEIMKSMITRKK